MISVAAKNAAFLTMAIELGHDATIYEERFSRALNKALEAAAPHICSGRHWIDAPQDDSGW